MRSRPYSNRRNVLKSAAVITGLTAGCTGNQNQATPTPTAAPTDTPETTTEAPTTTEGGMEQTATPEMGYEDALAALQESAQEDGEVFVRGTARSVVVGIIGEIFEEETGVSFGSSGGSTVQNIAQSLTEMEVGNLRADVLETTAPDERILAMQENAMMDDVLPPAVEYEQVSPYYKPDWDDRNRWMNISTYANLLTFNTNQVSADEVPRTFDEMLDPKWENSFSIDVDSVELLHMVAYEKGDWDAAVQWLEDFRSQIHLFDTSSYSLTVAVSDGRTPMILPGPSSLTLEFIELNDAPLDFVFPNNMAFLNNTAMGVLREAPNPNAAKLYLEIATRPEVSEQIFAQALDYPLDPELWPDHLQEVEETGELVFNDSEFIVEMGTMSGLSIREQFDQFQDIIGVG